MGKLKNLLIETDEEREVFERLQRDNALQALHDENERLGLYKPDEHLRLMEELAVARMLIRELGDRLAKLEGERNFCPRCGKRLVDGSIHTCTPPMENT
jgi:predicted AAA+ superfamily ATPase